MGFTTPPPLSLGAIVVSYAPGAYQVFMEGVVM